MQQLAKMTNLTPATERKIQTGSKKGGICFTTLQKCNVINFKMRAISPEINFLLSCHVCIEHVEREILLLRAFVLCHCVYCMSHILPGFKSVFHTTCND